MLPFILSVLIQLTVQIFNHINLVVFEPCALDLLLSSSWFHMPFASGITFPRIPCQELHEFQVIHGKERSPLQSLFIFCVLFRISPRLWNYSTSLWVSSTMGHSLVIVPWMPTFFSSIFALWNHLVTILSCMEYYSGKDYQASSKDRFT